MIKFLLSKFKKNTKSKDKKRYLIPSKVIKDTEKVLREYGNKDPSNEGLVYWAGTVSGNTIKITTVIAPNTDSNAGRVSTSHKDNFHVVNELSKLGLVEVAQVHSHPGYFVNHSDGDDEWTAFKFEGLLSLVVPNYCKDGMLPLEKCGIHRYENGEFARLSKEYVKKHFELADDNNSKFVELRK